MSWGLVSFYPTPNCTNICDKKFHLKNVELKLRNSHALSILALLCFLSSISRSLFGTIALVVASFNAPTRKFAFRCRTFYGNSQFRDFADYLNAHILNVDRILIFVANFCLSYFSTHIKCNWLPYSLLFWLLPSPMNRDCLLTLRSRLPLLRLKTPLEGLN
eukprot:Gregarina_sp_Poly_1__3489@NODE_2014_length_2858_cov_788_353278_g1301_i0_p1_GENE_NODE_2014_length_2858_cov_788_353278_g1301_i0NODE_2014_length_2858_cov_788_353278_g1301_i0_p1_ORF_typecomplete_len161_score13_61BofA/PF07441_11/1e03BofA/PF07441_11/0_46_NODE_2014_length_2858_cov_788_353278_g1301_i017022184